MNPRERKLAMALLAAVVLAAGAFLFYEFYLVPLDERQQNLRIVEEKVKQKGDRIKEVEDRRPKMAELRKLSLPGDIKVSQVRYEQFLNSLIQKSGIPQATMEIRLGSSGEAARGPTHGNKEPFLTPLSFTVTGRTDLAHLLILLKNFYSTPVLHRIRSLSITPSKPADLRMAGGSGPKSRELQVSLDVEAVIVQGAEKRDEILPKDAPAPRNLAEPAREYASLLAKDIFHGPRPAAPKPEEGPDPLKSVQLTGIFRDPDGHPQVVLCDIGDRTKTTMWYLYPDQGKDTKDIFEIRNRSGELKLEGIVTRVDDGAIVFRAGEKHYSIHVGQTLDQALRRPLTEAQVKALHPTQAAANLPTRTVEYNEDQ